MQQILLIEDDRALNQGLCKALKTDNSSIQVCSGLYASATDRQIVSCENLKDAKEQLLCGMPALILLDINLPDGSGLDFLQSVKRECPDCPVILLTANDTDGDIVNGLELGADDYITKPFSVEELLARIRVSQRRLAITPAGKQLETSVFENGGLKIDYTAGCTFLKDRELHLTPIEYKLLCLLSRNVGKVLTHTYITQQIWGRCSENDVASLRVFMATLRKKLELEKNGVQYIQTHIGIGYRMLRIEKPEQETKKDSINPQTII